MGTRDARVDAYITTSADFAKPILKQLREIVHEGCPEVEEAMKWSFPHFMYKGMLCSMASFTQHCAFGFWKGSLVLGGSAKHADAMGQFGRITSLADLPARKTLLAYVRKAKTLNDEDVKVPRKRKAPASKRVSVPDDLAAALGENRKARATFDAFTPSHKREYIEWLTEAKTDATRSRRLLTAVAWMAEGKSLNWKYARA